MSGMCGGGGEQQPAVSAQGRTARRGERCRHRLRVRPRSFDVKTITAPAGPLSVTLINKGRQPHTFKIDGTDFELKTPKHNDVKTGTVTLDGRNLQLRLHDPGPRGGGHEGHDRRLMRRRPG